MDNTEASKDYRSNLTGKTLAEKILLQPATSCSLTIPIRKPNSTSVTTTTYPFYMSEGLALGFSNEWKDLVDINDNAFVQAYNSVNSLRGVNNSHITAQSESMTNKVWRGSKFNGFNIKCLFVATNRNINTLEILTDICSTCLPIKLKDVGDQDLGWTKDIAKTAVDLGAGFLKNVGTGLKTVGKGILQEGSDALKGLNSLVDKYQNEVSELQKTSKNLIDDVGMVAPLQYGVHRDENGQLKPLKNTTISLQIGEYFKADELIVTDIGNIRTSKELIAPVSKYMTKNNNDLYDPTPSFASANAQGGFPLYVEFNMSLIPSSMLTLEKFRNYFTISQTNGILNSGLSLP